MNTEEERCIYERGASSVVGHLFVYETSQVQSLGIIRSGWEKHDWNPRAAAVRSAEGVTQVMWVALIAVFSSLQTGEGVPQLVP